MKSLVMCLCCVLMVSASEAYAQKPAGSTDTPVNIVANDSGFTLPDTLHSDLNHLVYEDHGHEIHECQFIHMARGARWA